MSYNVEGLGRDLEACSLAGAPSALRRILQAWSRRILAVLAVP